jgi:hypothetical protein
MQPLLTQNEAAELLKLSVRTVERLRVSGTGPKFLKIRNSVRPPERCRGVDSVSVSRINQ